CRSGGLNLVGLLSGPISAGKADIVPNCCRGCSLAGAVDKPLRPPRRAQISPQAGRKGLLLFWRLVPEGSDEGPKRGKIMSRASSFLVIAFIVVAVFAGGLFYLDRAVEPEIQSVEKVLPNDQFAR